MIDILSNLKPKVLTPSKRKGRGNSSGKGRTSGRGTKGQKARSGASRNIPAFFEGGQTKLAQRLPKRRGINGRPKKAFPIQYSVLEKHFENGAKITLVKLVKEKIISKNCRLVKVLKDMEPKKNFVIFLPMSRSLKSKIKNQKTAHKAKADNIH
ncbi:MAG: 50S ribosomal protein L15 [Patescibacteria group bacterium]